MTSQRHGHGVFAGEDDVVPVLGVVRLRVAVLSAPGVQVRAAGQNELSELSKEHCKTIKVSVSSSNQVSH